MNKKWHENTKLAYRIIDSIKKSIKSSKLLGTFIIGGGLSYLSSKYEKSVVNDIDSMFIFPKRTDVLRFITNTPEHIANSLGLNLNTLGYFNEDELQYFINNKIEILRLSCFFKGLKTSLRLTSMEDINFDKETESIRFLSKGKDKNNYPHYDIRGDLIKICVVNKKIKYSDVTCYDVLDKPFFKRGKTWISGMITNFIITSTARYESVPNQFSKLREKYLRSFVDIFGGSICEDKKWTDFICRKENFSNEYSKKINLMIDKVASSKKERKYKENQPLGKRYLLYISTPSNTRNYDLDNQCLRKKKKILPMILFDDDNSKIKFIKNDLIKNKVFNQINKIERIDNSSYSLNSNIGYFVTKHKKYFYKCASARNPKNIYYEVRNSNLFDKYFIECQKPLFVSDDYSYVVYNWNNGLLEAEIKVEEEDKDDLLLNIDLQRAGETLQLYRSSLLKASKCSTINEPIHNLYFYRIGSKRYHEYYRDSDIPLCNDLRIDFNNFEKMDLKINGIDCKPLCYYLKLANKYLNVKSLDKRMKIFGLGDAHIGNIMVNKDLKSYINIDYEFSGVHSPELEIAKYLYMDAFGKYSNYTDKNDIKFELPRIKIQDKKLVIEHNFKLAHFDYLIADLKLQGILLPLLRDSKRLKLNTNNSIQILCSALFICALLTKNITSFRPSVFWFTSVLAFEFMKVIEGEIDSNSILYPLKESFNNIKSYSS